jgi:hypothetical protein
LTQRGASYSGAGALSAGFHLAGLLVILRRWDRFFIHGAGRQWCWLLPVPRRCTLKSFI